MEALAELLERRVFDCRLTPDRALCTVGETETFLLDRGLLTRTVDCALPSLYEACHEEPYKQGSPGFAAWPATKWPWFGEVAERGYLLASVHRGKNLLVTGEVADLLDPICRAEITRMRAAEADLIAAGVRAAVVAPERELRRWFSWQWYWAGGLVDDLVGEGRLRRVDGHVTTAV